MTAPLTLCEWLNTITGQPAGLFADTFLFPRLCARDFAFYASDFCPLIAEWSLVTGAKLGALKLAIELHEDGGPFQWLNENAFDVLDEVDTSSSLFSRD
jgi:hypothetical protein